MGKGTFMPLVNSHRFVALNIVAAKGLQSLAANKRATYPPIQKRHL